MAAPYNNQPPSPPPPCPQCGNKSGISRIGLTYKCPRCRGLYDDDPNEGGTCYADPSKRMEKEEERRQRRLEKLGRRR